jgi:glycosyltransferase
MVAIGVSAMTEAVAHLVATPLAELDSLARLSAGSCAAALAATETFTSVPAILDGRHARTLHRYREEVTGAPAGRLPAPWGELSKPLVYVSFGSVAGSQGRFHSIYRAVLDVLADQPVRVLLTTGLWWGTAASVRR